jgi:hypothetical protein
MKKLNLILRLTTLASVIFPNLMSSHISVQASTFEQQAIVFEEQAIQQNNVIEIVRPDEQDKKYDLLIIEHIIKNIIEPFMERQRQTCSSEIGFNPLLPPSLVSLGILTLRNNCRGANN